MFFLCLNTYIFQFQVVLAQTLITPDFTNNCRLNSHLPATRPNSQNTATRVLVGIYILDLSEIKSGEQTVKVDFLLKLTWSDPHLKVTNCVVDLAKIWHPQVYFLNQKFLNKDFKEIVFIKNSSLTYTQRFTGEIYNLFNFIKFPFDQQIINLNFIIFSNQSQEIELVDQPLNKKISNKISLQGWSVESINSRIDEKYIELLESDFARYNCEITVVRFLKFHFWKEIFPISLMVFMAYLVFWLHPLLIVPQITLAVTTILSLVAFEFTLTDKLPQTFYLTSADKFIIGCILLIFLALVETIVTLNLAECKKQKIAVRIDWWMRWLFPSLFALVVIVSFF